MKSIHLSNYLLKGNGESFITWTPHSKLDQTLKYILQGTIPDCFLGDCLNDLWGFFISNLFYSKIPTTFYLYRIHHRVVNPRNADRIIWSWTGSFRNVPAVSYNVTWETKRSDSSRSCYFYYSSPSPLLGPPCAIQTQNKNMVPAPKSDIMAVSWALQILSLVVYNRLETLSSSYKQRRWRDGDREWKRIWTPTCGKSPHLYLHHPGLELSREILAHFLRDLGWPSETLKYIHRGACHSHSDSTFCYILYTVLKIEADWESGWLVRAA